MSNSIFKEFTVTDSEFVMIEQQFGKLNHFAKNQLYRNNVHNNQLNDLFDIHQELSIALITSAKYYKRQVYVNSCLDIAEKYVKDEFTNAVLTELKYLWKNRMRHGAGKQAFGEFQMNLLHLIIKKNVPLDQYPDKNRTLQMDTFFKNYAKKIIWNKQHFLGKQISKEATLRSGMVSLSEYNYLGGNSDCSFEDACN